MSPAERRVTLSSGHAIATYLVRPASPNPAKVLLLLNGGPGLPCEYLLHPHLPMVERGWTLVTYDQLGCGRSDHPDDASLWTLDRYVGELEELVAILELDRFFLLGHSWGTWFGTEYALRNMRRIRKYVISGGAVDIPHLVGELHKMRAALGEETVRMMVRREAEGSIEHPEYKAAITLLNHRHICRLDTWPEPLVRSLAQWNMGPYVTLQGPNEFTYTGSMKEWNRIPALPLLALPCLVACGEFDGLPPACSYRMHAALPDSRLEVFAGCSHMPFYEDPGTYFATLERFLAN